MTNYSHSKADRGAVNNIADFRSDTVTRPTDAMRQAIVGAVVGDDVYGEDPTINELEKTVAEMLGKEAGLFLASGTQSNLTALLTHCARGDEYIGGDIYHISKYEAGGAAVLGGISPRHLPVDQRGGLAASQVAAAINDDDKHFAQTRLVCLENTVNGGVQDQLEMAAITTMAHERGLLTHLDGARLMNASVASNASPARLAEGFDSVSLCLSKGLGAPVGSVLSGTAEFIKRAHRNRKLLGGDMRQAGILAAAGLYALEHHVVRLADDHRRARQIAEALANIDGIEIYLESVETNMVFITVAKEHQTPLHDHLAGRGILLDGGDPMFRIVTHLDIDDDAVSRLIGEIENYFAKKR